MFFQCFYNNSCNEGRNVWYPDKLINIAFSQDCKNMNFLTAEISAIGFYRKLTIKGQQTENA
jgi:hypothetical protein